MDDSVVNIRRSAWRSIAALTGVLIVALTLAACGSGSATPTTGETASVSIVVDQAWARPAPAGTGAATPMSGMSMATASPGSMDMSVATSTDAVYFTVHNSGQQSDEIVSASSSVADAVELHQSRMVNGVMTMQPVQSIVVNAGGELQFQPGGYHVMLIGMRRDLNVDDTFQITLTFRDAGMIAVPVEVKQQ